MGLILYKADFLYPVRDEPRWFRNEDVGPYIYQEDLTPPINNQEGPPDRQIEVKQ